MANVHVGKDWLLLFTFCGIFVLVFVFQSDIRTLLRYTTQILLGFGVLSFIIYWLDHYGVFAQFQKKRTSKKGLTKEETEVRQRNARQRSQNAYTNESTEYYEQVVKPRKEAKRKAAEEELYKFSGPAWKGHSDELGSANGASTSRARDGSSRDAAVSRQLPEHVVNPPKPAPKPKVNKKAITLPSEPSVDDPNSIMISLRTPLGNIHRRRFLKSDQMKTLLNYMTLLSYSQRTYCISSSYPRRVISNDTEQTLSQLGLVHDVYLNVEEIGEDSD